MIELLLGGGFGSLVTGAFVGFFFSAIGVAMVLGIMRGFGLYAIVEEGTCHVYTLFGRVLAVLREPGFHFLLTELGPAALVMNWLGKRYILDMRLDQRYLRSQPVNSEEGSPMGIGAWYEMAITDPVAYLFRNADPQGSLAANVSNSVVRALSNMPLDRMLEDRHAMSQAVRDEVSPKSIEWGYKLGSVYIRKVHFRDMGMIRQIEAKVVNRLRQVTSAISQDGANQVSIITSDAEKRAAAEFGRAEAIRPQIVGQALRHISSDQEVAEALFQILEYQSMIDGNAGVTLVASRSEIISGMIASEEAPQLTDRSRR